ncbi:MAG TPA: SDR family oxidoreductase [Burkholderiales bacterium]|jgi:NAD(P)-dependent dehydrogenase (short-subunit alcohol dehydrogenase family)|nr:SDR family oxidoreductase [Burkholderiales bacterium]
MTGATLSGVAVVTGGASGIGAACCRELAARGARVALVDRDQRVQSVARETGGRGWIADVADEAAIKHCADSIEAELGPVEILVNSAGVIQVPVPPDRLSMANWDEIVRVDQRGTYVAAMVFGTLMAGRRRGSIINIASVAGMRSMPLHAYAPAKAAVIAMTECLAAEWGPAQVRVNAVSPGYTRTPALQDAIDKGERDVTALARNAALGRLVEPVEIARAVAFLASDQAAAITGINLPVDCGWLVAGSWHTYGGLRSLNKQES